MHDQGALRGYWFEVTPETKDRSSTATGFFAGYLLSSRGWTFLSPHPPECLVFAFARPVGGALHSKLVAAPASLLRRTFEYVRWLTHRPPRFQFFDSETPALVRHIPLNAWPARRIEHYSRNFFIETFAWLVRSALVRKLAARNS
jgi:hypothetical protein